MKQLDQLRKGSTNLLILSILQDGRKYGYEIMREIEERSQGYFSMTAALLYPTLRRLEGEVYVQSEWVDGGENHRRRKYYTLTEKGWRVGDPNTDLADICRHDEYDDSTDRSKLMSDSFNDYFG
jgi:DNA-binding PadR family transcriptional regulator